jgi:hypothetical protein
MGWTYDKPKEHLHLIPEDWNKYEWEVIKKLFNAEGAEVIFVYMSELHIFRPDGPSEIDKLKRQLEWFNDFADAVMGDSSTYDSACEYADEKEIEKYGHNYTGNYSSVHDFIDEFGLHDRADEVFGEDWEAENDIEQIQQLVGDDFIVKAVEPKTKREERMDDYIEVRRANNE